MALQSQILSFPIIDNHNSLFLVRASPRGDQPLDLDLLATDGESVFRSRISQDRLSPPSKVEFGLEAWTSILLYVFLRQAVPDEHTATVKGLVVEAMVKRSQAEVKILRNIQGIQQHLWTFSLPEDNDEALQLFDWTGEAASQLQSSFQTITTLQRRLGAQDGTIENLKGQLEDLINAKNEHEDSMLEKFRDLLNSKKLKIRDQQRLLATATVDQEQLGQFQAARTDVPMRESQPSRGGKRKATAADDVSSSDSESFAPAVNVRAASEKEQNEDDEDPPSTPEPVEDETTEDEEMDMDLEPSVPAASALPSRSTRKARETVPAPASLPPRRDLPFVKQTERKAEHKAVEEDDGGETDDDEL